MLHFLQNNKSVKPDTASHEETISRLLKLLLHILSKEVLVVFNRFIEHLLGFGNVEDRWFFRVKGVKA